jgi:hypothetical protein
MVLAAPSVMASETDSGVHVSIGGQYRAMANQSNFNFHQMYISQDEKSRHFFNVRFRTWLDVTSGENVSGHLQLESGHILFGEGGDFPKTYGGDDKVGVEIRRAFLTHRSDVGQFRVGIQDWSDSFGHVLADADWDFDVGGIHYSRSISDASGASVGLGVFRIIEDHPGIETDNTDLYAVDLDLPIGEDYGIGASVYFLRDNGAYSYVDTVFSSAREYWVGVRGNAHVGEADLDAFVILNSGTREGPDWDHQGYAARVRGMVPIGETSLGLQAAVSTGNDSSSTTESDEFLTVAQTFGDGAGAASYWSYLAISSPHGPSDVNDLGVSLQNFGLGLITVQGQLSFPLRDRISGRVAGGWLRSMEKNPANGETAMGSELMGEIDFDLSGGLVLQVGAAVLFAGDFFKGHEDSEAPENLEEVFARFQLEF